MTGGGHGRTVLFEDRNGAGRALGPAVAAVLGGPLEHPPLVLALPRGGVPVAVHVAAAIHGDLDLMLVAKINAPGRPEWGVGAIGRERAAALRRGRSSSP
jgi:putative phosphoribosyl transferase